MVPRNSPGDLVQMVKFCLFCKIQGQVCHVKFMPFPLKSIMQDASFDFHKHIKEGTAYGDPVVRSLHGHIHTDFAGTYMFII